MYRAITFATAVLWNALGILGSEKQNTLLEHLWMYRWLRRGETKLKSQFNHSCSWWDNLWYLVCAVIPWTRTLWWMHHIQGRLCSTTLNLAQFLGQKVWPQCQVLLLAQINPELRPRPWPNPCTGWEASKPDAILWTHFSCLRSSFDCVLSCSFKSPSQMSVSAVISLSI